MQFKQAFIGAALAAAVAALPQSTPVTEEIPFTALTIRSGTDVQNQAIQAARSNLFIGLASQNASCPSNPNANGNYNAATFIVKDTELLLLTGSDSDLKQTVFVDRSGMGQGVIGYVTGADTPVGRNSETKGWAIKDNQLTFKDIGVQVCPGSAIGGSSLWLQGFTNPGGNKDCLDVGIATFADSNAQPCYYTE